MLHWGYDEHNGRGAAGGGPGAAAVLPAGPSRRPLPPRPAEAPPRAPPAADFGSSRAHEKAERAEMLSRLCNVRPSRFLSRNDARLAAERGASCVRHRLPESGRGLA